MGCARLRLTAGLTAAVLCCGCLSVNIKGPVVSGARKPAATPGGGAHPRGTHGPACDLIDGAATVDFPSDQRKVLEKIAARPTLSTHEQVYLINMTFNMKFSSDQAAVLTALASNPALTAKGRAHLVDRLEEVRFSSDRRRVVEALADNDAGGRQAG